MKYTAHTIFEILSYLPTVDADGIEVPYVVQVAANGASRIQFLALPLFYVNTDGPIPPSEEEKVRIFHSLLIRSGPTVNGFPLLPTIIDNSRVLKNQPFTFYDRIQDGDRLDFNHGPGVIDQTIYKVEFCERFPIGNHKYPGARLMVIRTFITPQ